MKKFEDFLIEGALAGSIRDALDELQNHWNENAEFYLKKGIYPILTRPFAHAKKNGVIVMGYNHAAPDIEKPFIEKLIRAFNGKFPPVYDKQTKKWNFRLGTEKELTQARTNVGDPVFLKQMNKKSGELYDFPGEVTYHRNFIRFFRSMGFGEIFSEDRIVDLELIPFPSKNTSQTVPSKIESLSVEKFIKPFLKITTPKIIFTTTSVYDRMASSSMKVEEHKKEFIPDFGKGKNRQMILAKVEGIPLIVVPHWSSATTGWMKAFQDEERKVFLFSLVKEFIAGKSTAQAVSTANKKVEDEVVEPSKATPVVMHNSPEVLKFYQENIGKIRNSLWFDDGDIEGIKEMIAKMMNGEITEAEFFKEINESYISNLTKLLK